MDEPMEGGWGEGCEIYGWRGVGGRDVRCEIYGWRKIWMR